MRFDRDRFMFKAFSTVFGVMFVGVLTAIVLGIVVSKKEADKVEYVIATISDKKEHIHFNGSNTMYRYIVITDKETFIIENSFWNDKFNNTDLFYRLEVGKKYNFKVCGFGKTVVTDYRNILSVSEIN